MEFGITNVLWIDGGTAGARASIGGFTVWTTNTEVDPPYEGASVRLDGRGRVIVGPADPSSPEAPEPGTYTIDEAQDAFML